MYILLLADILFAIIAALMGAPTWLVVTALLAGSVVLIALFLAIVGVANLFLHSRATIPCDEADEIKA